MDKLEEVSNLISKICGFEKEVEGNKARFIDNAGNIQLYLFPRANIPRLGLYGIYAAHFIEVWEGERLEEGKKIVIDKDDVLSCVYKALRSFNEKLIRVIKLRGKYGDPHISLSFETNNFQVIREFMVFGNIRFLPRVKSGGYVWRKPKVQGCLGDGLYGWLDGHIVRFKKNRIGFVRGLYVFKDCKLVADIALYEDMREFEEKDVEGIFLKKLPYRLAAILVDESEVCCCGYKVAEVFDEEAWETPLWKRVYDRFELVVKDLVFSVC